MSTVLPLKDEYEGMFDVIEHGYLSYMRWVVFCLEKID